MDAGWCDRRRPEVHGLLHALVRRQIAIDRFARVLATVTDDRETVVLAALDDVDLVTALRSVRARPDLAGARMDVEPLVLTQPERIDLRVSVRVADERIVARH